MKKDRADNELAFLPPTFRTALRSYQLQGRNKTPYRLMLQEDHDTVLRLRLMGSILLRLRLAVVHGVPFAAAMRTTRSHAPSGNR